MRIGRSRITHRRKASGFTLIELLLVVAVILVLAGITFGISRGVRNAQARAQAKAELAVLAQAIEGYKLRYGDYPWHDSEDSLYDSSAGEVTSTMLLYALTGRMTIERATNGDVVVRKVADRLSDAKVVSKPKFLDHTKFTYTGSDAEPKTLLDPWGNPYVYWYKWENTQGNSWEVFGYHLYSTGPKGSAANTVIKGKINETTGVLTNDFRDVANAEGIIFSGE